MVGAPGMPAQAPAGVGEGFSSGFQPIAEAEPRSKAAGGREPRCQQGSTLSIAVGSLDQAIPPLFLPVRGIVGISTAAKAAMRAGAVEPAVRAGTRVGHGAPHQAAPSPRQHLQHQPVAQPHPDRRHLLALLAFPALQLALPAPPPAHAAPVAAAAQQARAPGAGPDTQATVITVGEGKDCSTLATALEQAPAGATIELYGSRRAGARPPRALERAPCCCWAGACLAGSVPACIQRSRGSHAPPPPAA